MTQQLTIRRLDLMQSNVYLMSGGGSTVMIDTGGTQTLTKLRKQLSKHGVGAGDIAAIVLTHAHPDHAGAASALRDELGAPVLIHEAEASWLEAGQTELFEPCGVFGRILDKVLDREFPAFQPDETLNDGDDLTRFGIDAEIVHTPGHTPGSICVLGAEGQVVVGDLLGGGVMRSDRPRKPFFVQDRQRLNASVQQLLERQPATWHFGHGKRASSHAVRTRWNGM